MVWYFCWVCVILSRQEDNRVCSTSAFAAAISGVSFTIEEVWSIRFFARSCKVEIASSCPRICAIMLWSIYSRSSNLFKRSSSLWFCSSREFKPSNAAESASDAPCVSLVILFCAVSNCFCTCSEMVSMAASVVSSWSVMLSTERDSADCVSFVVSFEFSKISCNSGINALMDSRFSDKEALPFWKVAMVSA